MGHMGKELGFEGSRGQSFSPGLSPPRWSPTICGRGAGPVYYKSSFSPRGLVLRLCELDNLNRANTQQKIRGVILHITSGAST